MTIKSPLIMIGLFAFGAAHVLHARDIRVANRAALTAALVSAGAGDVVILAKGKWHDVELKITQGGAEGRPLVIRAEAPGETILGGTSRLEITAPYVTVDGLFFYKGAIAKGSVVALNSHHGIVRNTAIVDYNPVDFATEYYWVYFSGDYNLIDRCYFKGKNNAHPLIGNAIEDSRHNGVVNSYFKNIPYHAANGRENIRVWGTGKFDTPADDGAYFTIQGNLFDKADGEGTEIVSLKSNHNKLIGNTVLGTRGCLNIRRGDYNLVQGNIILGAGVVGAQGLRMSGSHNTVTGNYVSGCEFGIRVSAGEYVAKALTADFAPSIKDGAKGKTDLTGIVPTYPQVTHLQLRNNTLVGNTGADLEMGFLYKRKWPASQLVLMPEHCVIEGNRFVRPKGGDSIIGSVPDTEAPFNQFKPGPNRYAGNVLVGGKNAFAPAGGGYTSKPLPGAWSEVKERAAFKPLTAADVGPAWVIAFRKAGIFAMENDLSCYRTPTHTASALQEKAHKKKKSHD